jgi:hypothetical protein
MLEAQYSLEKEPNTDLGSANLIRRTQIIGKEE